MSSPIVDVAVGLIFIYVVLSLLASSVQEWIASVFGLRSRNLYQGIRRLVGEHYATEVYNHPMIRRLAKKDRWPVHDEPGKMGFWKRMPIGIWHWLFPKAPSYIDSRTLSTVLMAVIAERRAKPGDGSDKDGVEDVDQIVRTIRGLNGDTDSDANAGLAEWFDEGMNRVSGWYKRKAKAWIVGVAVAITLVTNASTIHIAEQLWVDDSLRTALAEQGVALAEAGTSLDELEESHRAATVKALPISWNRGPPEGGVEWGKSVVGWLITVMAISLGAPFWFDLLGRVANLRGSGGQSKGDERPGKRVGSEAGGA